MNHRKLLLAHSSVYYATFTSLLYLVASGVELLSFHSDCGRLFKQATQGLRLCEVLQYLILRFNHLLFPLVTDVFRCADVDTQDGGGGFIGKTTGGLAGGSYEDVCTT